MLRGDNATLTVVAGLQWLAIAVKIGLRAYDVFLRARLTFVMLSAVLPNLGLALALCAAHRGGRTTSCLCAEPQAQCYCQ